jgi:hypothetical protein
LRLRNSLFWISAYFECFGSDLKFVALGEANRLTFLGTANGNQSFQDRSFRARGWSVDQARKSSGNHWMNVQPGERGPPKQVIRSSDKAASPGFLLCMGLFLKHGITNAAAPLRRPSDIGINETNPSTLGSLQISGSKAGAAQGLDYPGRASSA